MGASVRSVPCGVTSVLLLPMPSCSKAYVHNAGGVALKLTGAGDWERLCDTAVAQAQTGRPIAIANRRQNRRLEWLNLGKRSAPFRR